MANTLPAGSQSARQILVVDDDPSIRLLCATSMGKAGYRVLADLFLPPPDFQLCSSNNRYPRVNGHDLVQQLLTLKKGTHPVHIEPHTQ